MLEHDNWLKMAREDLQVAIIVLPQGLYSPVTYHCQQAAEKALKGYLILKNQPVIKTHDLGRLLILCLKFDNDFEILREPVRILNPYSTKFRYPSEYDVPDESDAEIAIAHAKKIISLIQKKVADPQNAQTHIFE